MFFLSIHQSCLLWVSDHWLCWSNFHDWSCCISCFLIHDPSSSWSSWSHTNIFEFIFAHNWWIMISLWCTIYIVGINAMYGSERFHWKHFHHQSDVVCCHQESQLWSWYPPELPLWQRVVCILLLSIGSMKQWHYTDAWSTYTYTS